jgi:hypothetical protein
MFLKGAFRRQLSSHILLQRYEHLLNAASTPQEYWAVIEDACREFRFRSARLRLADESFEYQEAGPAEISWEIHIPFSERQHIDLARAFGELSHGSAIGPFAELLRRTISPSAAKYLLAEKSDRYRVVSGGL